MALAIFAADDGHARAAAAAEVGNRRFVSYAGTVYRLRAARRAGVYVHYEPMDGSGWRLETDARTFGSHQEQRSECLVCFDALDEATAVVLCENGRGCLHAYCLACAPLPSRTLRERRIVFCIACNTNRCVA
jgi:hypothetical protein